MAKTSYGVNAPEAVKLWSRMLTREALKQTNVAPFIGSDSNSIIHLKTELSKDPGDRIRCILRMQLSGDGVQGDGTLEGNEEALTTYTDDVLIDQLRHAVRSGGQMSEQRIPFPVREEARVGLTDWWADRFELWFFNQMCGYTAQSDVRYTGLQAAIAPDANHIMRAGGEATDEALDAAGTAFDITLIDKLVTQAKTISPVLRPIRTQGGKYFVLFLHPYQVYQLRTSTTAGQWLDIQKAAMTGGRVSNSPIFTGALGMYNGVVLHENTRVTQGVHSTTGAAVPNVRRAVFCGAQACALAMAKGGKTPGRSKPNWFEELFDYGNQLGVAAGFIAGMKKTVYNSADFGSIVMCSDSPNPNA